MAVPPPRARRRPRPGSLDRPVNGRLYRGTWLLVGLPLLLVECADCADLDEAIEIASKHPSAWYGTTEVRPIAGEHCEDFG